MKDLHINNIINFIWWQYFHYREWFSLSHLKTKMIYFTLAKKHAMDLNIIINICN